MIPILKKDLRIFWIYSLIMLIPATLFWAFHRDDKYFGMAVFIHLAITYAITTMTVLMNEQEEDFQKGYRFLRTLPLRKREVTAAKFLLPVIMILILGLIGIGIYTLFFHPGQEAMGLTLSMTLLFSMFFLLNCAFIYLGVYLLGYTNFIKSVSGLISGFVLVSFVTAKVIVVKASQMVDTANALQDWLVKGDHLPVLLGGFILYTLMGMLANGIEKK